MRKTIRRALFAILCPALLHGCMKYGPTDEEDFDFGGGNSGPQAAGVFITNEGNFMYGNASLSYYIPSEKKVENEVFNRANGINLGDVAQSMAIRGETGYIAVNNSGIIFAVDVNTFKVVGSVTGLVSPRYIHFVNDEKAYVTDLYNPAVTIFNPRTLAVTGSIPVTGHRSTEQMVQYGKYVFTNCWSYDNKVLVIDSEQDKLTDSITVGIQPVSLGLDRYGKLWVLTGGGYDGSPYGHEAPELCRIDAATRTIEKRFAFLKGDAPSELVLNGTQDTLYFLNRSVWRMNVKDERLPLRPFLKYGGTLYYGLAVDPATSEVYVADAIDYVQPGVVYRFTPQGVATDTFRAGITPGAFCFKPATPPEP